LLCAIKAHKGSVRRIAENSILLPVLLADRACFKRRNLSGQAGKDAGGKQIPPEAESGNRQKAKRGEDFFKRTIVVLASGAGTAGRAARREKDGIVDRLTRVAKNASWRASKKKNRNGRKQTETGVSKIKGFLNFSGPELHCLLTAEKEMLN